MQPKVNLVKIRRIVRIATILCWILVGVIGISFFHAIQDAHNTSDVSGLTSLGGSFEQILLIIVLIPVGLVAVTLTVVYLKEKRWLRK